MGKALLRAVACLSLLAVVGLGPARAQSILYYVDLTLGTDQMAAALAALPGSYTVTTATDPTDFATQIALGTFDLGIFFQQNSSGLSYDAAFTALNAFVAGGGAAIATDWTLNNTHTTGLGATYTLNTNETTVTVTDPALATGISNPVDLFNPGWGIFSTGLSGTTAATFASAEGAIVVGNGGRSIVNGFLSDTFLDGPEGVQLYTNEIVSVLATPVVPEPGSLAMLAGGGLAFGVFALRRMRRA
ncbi:MAG: PEP-CTERM sorting domain-containing protein [Chthonomonadales bacterium]|nr:PEP-CTERM sorting domain-containing protein [Chthonomonadales bacterium]